MRLRDFELLAPNTVEQASAWLAQAGADGQIIAGGTDLIPAMKERLKRPRVLVNLAAIPNLDYIRLDGSSMADPGNSSDMPVGLRIGAMTRLKTLARSPMLSTHYPLLAQAARAAGSPHIRNLATIGGNICLDRRCWYYNQSATWREARPPCFKASGDTCYVVKGGDDCYSLCQADLVPPLLALEAMVTVVSPLGTTERPLAALYPPLGSRATTLEPGEVVTEIRLPPAPAVGVYVKYAVRPSVDFPLVSVAALLYPSDDRVCGDARLVIGGVTPAPVRATQAEALLRGQVVTPELLESTVEAALKAVKPIPFIHQSVSDRRQLTRACLRQALRAALSPQPFRGRFFGSDSSAPESAPPAPQSWGESPAEVGVPPRIGGLGGLIRWGGRLSIEKPTLESSPQPPLSSRERNEMHTLHPAPLRGDGGSKDDSHDFLPSPKVGRGAGGEGRRAGMKERLRIQVNGEWHEMLVPRQRTLLEFLREDLGLAGTKRACNLGECGACVVLLDGETVPSCLYLAVRANGKSVVTIEGLATNGRLHPVQVAFHEHGAIQCGYCTPGMILTVKRLLDENPQPAESEVRAALSGNICRCTGYVQILGAVMDAAERLAATGGSTTTTAPYLEGGQP